MQTTVNKRDLRSRLLHNREHYEDRDNAIYESLIKIPQFLSAGLILTYVSMTCEIDTKRFISHCFALSKSVAAPKVVGDMLLFKQIKSFDDLESGCFGTYEPKEYCAAVKNTMNTFCVVPALACDVNNYRIGYGKGYYDRFLRDYKGFSAALCYSSNIIDIPTDENDVPVNMVLTDNTCVCGECGTIRTL